MKKRGQLFGMPFTTIFSIFLIAIFIVVAFFAIKYFLNIRRCSEMGLFTDDFQNEITSAWQSPSSYKTFIRSLPSGIEYVCFADLSKEADAVGVEREIYQELKRNADYTVNLFFYPRKKACIPYANIEHINMTMSNPYCFPVENGKVEIKIEKEFYDPLVKVSR
jgi:hypothetical protein